MGTARRKEIPETRGETYRHCAVRGVLGLSLVQFHLLLVDNCLHFGMLGADNQKEIFCEDFRSGHLAFLGAPVEMANLGMGRFQETF